MIGSLALWWLDHAPTRLRPSVLGIVSYVGPASGRIIRLVVLPLQVDGDWVVVVGNFHRKSRYKAFRRPLVADITIAGKPVEVDGPIVTGRERERLLEAYDRQFSMRRPKHAVGTPVVRCTPRSPAAGV